MQWDEEGGHVLSNITKAYTNPRGQAGSGVHLWPGCDWDTRNGMQKWFRLLLMGLAGRESGGGVVLCHSQDKDLSQSRKMCSLCPRGDRDTPLSYRGRMLCGTKTHWDRDEGAREVGAQWSHLQCLQQVWKFAPVSSCESAWRATALFPACPCPFCSHLCVGVPPAPCCPLAFGSFCGSPSTVPPAVNWAAGPALLLRPSSGGWIKL